jgi:rubredoxin
MSGMMNESATLRSFQCFFCGFIYHEAKGWPEEGFAPGTRWEDIPDDWFCPECGAAKADFALIEV